MISTILSKIRHPLVANSFYLYLAHFADYLLALIVLPFIARILGPAELNGVFEGMKANECDFSKKIYGNGNAGKIIVDSMVEYFA